MKKFIPKITSPRQLDELLSKQKQLIVKEVRPFPADTPEKKQARLSKAKDDFFFFCKTYLPHYFEHPFSWHHAEMRDHAELKDGSITLVLGARETQKTVLLAIAHKLFEALNELCYYIVFDAHTEDLATDRLIAIKAELESNPRIVHDYGEMENPGLWEMDDFTLRSGTRFKAFGYKGHVRGLLNGPYRPDRVVVEDFENKATARNIKISSEKKEHILEEIYPVLKDNGKGANMLWLSNFPGKKCAAALFRDETEQNIDFGGKRHVLFYPLEIDANTNISDAQREKFKDNLLQPDIKDRKFCDNLRATVGTLAYEREYKLNPIVEGRIFQENWFKEYKALPKILRAVMYTDPSFGKSKSACKKAVILLGWTGHKYVVIAAWIRHATITSMIEAQYSIWKEWRTKEINLHSSYVDDCFGQLDRLKTDYKAAAKRHGWRFPVLPWNYSIDKNMDIESNAGLIERGDMLFDLTDPDQRELRDQFVFYPDHPDKDGPDAVSKARAILDSLAIDGQGIISVVKRKFQRRRMAAGS